MNQDKKEVEKDTDLKDEEKSFKHDDTVSKFSRNRLFEFFNKICNSNLF